VPFLKICGAPFRIVAGVYLCLSILAGYGVAAVLSKKNVFYQNIVFSVFAVLIIFEGIDTFPVLHKNRQVFYCENEQKRFYRKISEDREDYAILDLPTIDDFDRVYMLYQSYHEKRISCVCLRRSPLANYNFLNFLPLYLRTTGTHPELPRISTQDISKNMEHLKKHRIKYVILHKLFSGKSLYDYQVYENIIDLFMPLKKTVLTDCVIYQFW
jgi:hypothetical protein